MFAILLWEACHVWYKSNRLIGCDIQLQFDYSVDSVLVSWTQGCEFEPRSSKPQFDLLFWHISWGGWLSSQRLFHDLKVASSRQLESPYVSSAGRGWLLHWSHKTQTKYIFFSASSHRIEKKRILAWSHFSPGKVLYFCCLSTNVTDFVCAVTIQYTIYSEQQLFEIFVRNKWSNLSGTAKDTEIYFCSFAQ